MQKEFEMSLLGELTFFLGLQISQRTEGIFIAQTKYIKEMLKKFKMEDCKLVSTPMITSCKLSTEDESEEVDQRLYRSMIDSLLYVTTSRLDVMQALDKLQDSKLLQRNLTLLQLKGSSYILKELWTLVSKMK